MNKKRWGTLLLAGLLMVPLASCGGGGKSSASSSEPGSASLPEEPSVSVIAPVEDPEPLHINPLTGEEADEGFSAKRPFAVMINNLSKADRKSVV